MSTDTCAMAVLEIRCQPKWDISMVVPLFGLAFWAISPHIPITVSAVFIMFTDSFLVCVRRIWSNYFFSSLFPVESNPKCAPFFLTRLKKSNRIGVITSQFISIGCCVSGQLTNCWMSEQHELNLLLIDSKSFGAAHSSIDFLCCKMICCWCVFALSDENLNIFKSICGWYLKQSTLEPHTNSKTIKPGAFNIIETLYIYLGRRI